MKNLKEIYETKINKQDIYNKVLKKIENRHEKYKISLVILLIVTLMIGIRVVFKNDYKIYAGNNNSKYDENVTLENNEITLTDKTNSNQPINNKATLQDKLTNDILNIIQIILKGDENV